MIKVLIILFFLLVVLSVVYGQLTNVRVVNGKPKISSIACAFSNKQNSDTPVIFVHGIKGSVLEKENRKVWFGLPDALHNTAPLIYTEGDGVRATDLLSRVSIVPGLLEYSVYYRIAKELACITNGYVFIYDWRDHVDTNSEKFGTFVEQVKAETGKNPAVIAHSMGGLVAHGYIKQHPGNIAKVVYVSVPFWPGIGYFDDVNDGAPTAFNKTVLSKEAVFSHPATYYLLAHKGSNQYEGHDFFEAVEWRENKWSIFKDPPAIASSSGKLRAGSSPDMAKFQNILGRVAKYHELLDKKTEINIPALIITAKCFLNNQRQLANGERPLVPGDKRVSHESAFPYDTFANMQEKDFCVAHDSQMNDKKLLEAIFEFIG